MQLISVHFFERSLNRNKLILKLPSIQFSISLELSPPHPLSLSLSLLFSSVRCIILCIVYKKYHGIRVNRTMFIYISTDIWHGLMTFLHIMFTLIHSRNSFIPKTCKLWPSASNRSRVCYRAARDASCRKETCLFFVLAARHIFLPPTEQRACYSSSPRTMHPASDTSGRCNLRTSAAVFGSI